MNNIENDKSIIKKGKKKIWKYLLAIYWLILSITTMTSSGFATNNELIGVSLILLLSICALLTRYKVANLIAIGIQFVYSLSFAIILILAALFFGYSNFIAYSILFSIGICNFIFTFILYNIWKKSQY